VYDPVDGTVYVSDQGTGGYNGQLEQLNGSTDEGNVSAGANPTGMAYDSETGTIYVADYGSGMVTLVRNGSAIGSVDVQAGPFGADYDSANGWVYVVDFIAGSVSILDGIHVEATVPAGSVPDGVTYDPADGYVYISDAGSGSVMVLDGTTDIATIGVGSGPAWGAYDAADQCVYIPDSGTDTVSVLQGTQVVANVTVMPDPYAALYDAGTENVYVDNESPSLSVPGPLAVLHGTEVVENLSAGLGGERGAYDPANGELYIANYFAGRGPDGTVTLISTALGLGPLGRTVPSHPPEAADVGEPLNLSASLWGVGEPPDAGTVSTVPANGLGGPLAAHRTGDLAGGPYFIAGTPQQPGNYTLNLTVTDRAGGMVSSSVRLRVYPALVARPPIASIGSRTGLTSVDAGALVNFTEAPTGGTGLYSQFVWSGFPLGACTRTLTATPTCTFYAPGELNVSVSWSDGVQGASARLLNFTVEPHPFAAPPTADRARADVGQVVTFRETAGGGSGGFVEYLWSGLPASGCQDTNDSTPSCTLDSAANLSISVVAIDASGTPSAPSAPLSLLVSPDPVVSPPELDPATLPLGHWVEISVSVSGGAGALRFNWSGLPPGCAGGDATFLCDPGASGRYAIAVVVSDASGFNVSSGAATLTVQGRSTGPATIDGWTYGELGLFAAIGAVVLGTGAWFVRQRRRARGAPPATGGSPGPEGTPEGGETEPAPPPFE
jgi:YVTN family beta-propeller protein